MKYFMLPGGIASRTAFIGEPGGLIRQVSADDVAAQAAVVEACKDLLALCIYQGDFRNGVEGYGQDEGAVKASRIIANAESALNAAGFSVRPVRDDTTVFDDPFASEVNQAIGEEAAARLHEVQNFRDELPAWNTGQ